ncbi:MAG TPA: helix-turn-helix domain-containing protein [Blastocatellia bacterium]|nr:helix-turn-helix domain-containing protein [Blastocatellia bacterium]
MTALDEITQTVEPQADELSAQASTVEIQRFISRPEFTIRHTAARGCRFDEHSHTAYTVTAILSGEMAASISSSELQLSAGEVALTNINQPHAAHALSVEFVSININPSLVGELVTELGLARATNDIVFRSSVASDETIISIARALVSEMADEKLGHGAMLDVMVRQMVIHLLRSHFTVRKSAQIELSRAGPVDRRLRRAIEFMHDNFGRELALEEIASAAYLSEYHFARLFKQITGQTPHAYLANLRIERARRLLAETRLSISEIAATVGYQSQSHFTKVFKSITGLTPRAYRESNGQ